MVVKYAVEPNMHGRCTTDALGARGNMTIGLAVRIVAESSGDFTRNSRASITDHHGCIDNCSNLEASEEQVNLDRFCVVLDWRPAGDCAGAVPTDYFNVGGVYRASAGGSVILGLTYSG